ncbi:hypothetical protein CDD83_5062 [Cordyceps sp. RAO-2017]|nr:hypothetical protein CDD83_5062 [Cordyceps sp. RAO-2017]
MSHAITRRLPPPAPPPTAPVLEHACLFTHDLRRKQKRWQDGRLRFHAFNGRVMVYDERGALVGDAHRRGAAPREGDELELDRGAALVLVAQRVAERLQDLSALVERRARAGLVGRGGRDGGQQQQQQSLQERGQQQQQESLQQRGQQQQRQQSLQERGNQQQPHFQLNHRPLRAIVPSPGPLGRAAIPTRSPFEIRRAEEEEAAAAAAGDDTPTVKRRRVRVASPPSKAGYAQSLFGTRLTLSSYSLTPLLSSSAARARGPNGELGKAARDEEDEDLVMLDGPPQPHRATAPASGVLVDARARAANRNAPVRLHVAARDDGNDDNGAASRPALETSSSRQNQQVSDDTVEKVPQRSDTERKADRGSLRARAGAASQPKRKATSERREQAETPAVQDSPVPPDNKTEPRTELRIRPRQRRGLLVVSEQRQQRRVAAQDPQPTRMAPSTDGPSGLGGAGRCHDEDPVEQVVAAAAQPGLRPLGRATRTSAGSSSESDVAPLDRGRRRRPAAACTEGSSDEDDVGQRKRVYETDDDAVEQRQRVCESEDATGESDTPDSAAASSTGSRQSPADDTSSDGGSADLPSSSPPPRRKRPRRRAPEEAEAVPPRPRIAKLARKGIKSREIIGFVPPALEAIVPAPFAAAASRIAAGPVPVATVERDAAAKSTR